MVADVFLWFSAVPEDGIVEKPVYAAHWEAALFPAVLPTDCALSLPSTLQGAVRLRHWYTHSGYSLKTCIQLHSTQSTLYTEQVTIYIKPTLIFWRQLYFCNSETKAYVERKYMRVYFCPNAIL